MNYKKNNSFNLCDLCASVVKFFCSFRDSGPGYGVGDSVVKFLFSFRNSGFGDERGRFARTRPEINQRRHSAIVFDPFGDHLAGNRPDPGMNHLAGSIDQEGRR